jgi:predicted phage-related endonuclease
MRVMKGEWQSLYLEKIGEKMPVDLTDNFSVQLGSYTEPFHRDWFQKRSGFLVNEPQPFYVHPDQQFMFAHLDAWLFERNTFVELKHSHERNSAVLAAQYYMPQLAHCCHVVSAKECWISVILGNKEPDYTVVEVTQEYVDLVVEMETAFWWHVEQRVLPDIIPVAKLGVADKLVAEIPIGGMKAYDMSTSNEWANLAGDWLSTKDAAELNDKAGKLIKGLVPPDGREASGHGVVVRRDKAGRLSLRREG